MITQDGRAPVFGIRDASSTRCAQGKSIHHLQNLRGVQALIGKSDSMGGWADLSTMKNIYIHTQQEDLEEARQLLTT